MRFYTLARILYLFFAVLRHTMGAKNISAILFLFSERYHSLQIERWLVEVAMLYFLCVIVLWHVSYQASIKCHISESQITKGDDHRLKH
jgi:hypothetical protein